MNQKQTSYWIFPGQGSQELGMSTTFLEQNPQYIHFFQTAQTIIQKPLLKLICEDVNSLNDTSVVQPALYTISCMYAQFLLDNNHTPAAVAGHSLGEFAAMYAANIISFEDGLKIIQARSAYMQEVCSQYDSGMIACLFANGAENTFSLCTQLANKAAENTQEICQIANFNTNEQIIISGTAKALQYIIEHAKDYNIIKTIMLKTAGAYHSQIMKPAAEKMKQFFINNPIIAKNSTIPVICNITAQPLQIENIQNNIVEQIYSSVLWLNSIQYMQAMQPLSFIEVGHGTVLTKMLQKQQIECKHCLDLT